MTAELRIMGNKVAVYTNDNQVYRRFRRGLVPLQKIRYFKSGRVVGVDLYFDKRQKSAVARIMRGQLRLNI